MGRQVIIGKHLETGQKCVFDTLEAASELIGVSIATVSRATAGCEECAGWKLRRGDRVFAIKIRATGEWRIVVEDGRGTGYMEYERSYIRIRKKDVEKVKDITGEWYL